MSAGCKNCYAERVSERLAGRGGYPADDPFRLTLHPGRLLMPVLWTRPRRIFVDSMSDLFHRDVPDEYIAAVFGAMAAAPRHVFQVLTKRPERMVSWLVSMERRARALAPGLPKCRVGFRVRRELQAALQRQTLKGNLPEIPQDSPWPLPNVWLGVSVEDQTAADTRIPKLLGCPATVRFLSCEPLLGPVNLGAFFGPRLQWVIAGGESGPDARPCDPDWVRSLRDQCMTAGAAFFFKQYGGSAGKRGHEEAVLDGRLWHEMPTALSV